MNLSLSRKLARIRRYLAHLSPSPFNLIELCILPFELCLSKERYYRLNAFILTIIFSPALVIIALFESKIDRFKVKAAEEAQLEDGDDLDEDVGVIRS